MSAPVRLTRRRLLAASAVALALPSPPAYPATGRDAVREAAAAMPQLWSLSISVDGTARLAERFRGPPLERFVNIKSVSKTLVSALAGAAIDRGLIDGPGAVLGDLAPQLIPRGADPRVAGISIGHLLSLTAGLERTSGPGYGDWVSSRDWVADALARPMVAAPGSRFLYSTGSTHVLGAVLSEITGRSLHALATDWIAGPLGAELPRWTRDPQGRYLGGNEMAMTPSALVAFAEAYRNGGAPVVSSAWVEASWTPRARSPFSGDLYGYGWFLRDVRGHRTAYARGCGGQLVWVTPSLGLTAVAISDPSQPARSDGHVGDLQKLFAETVVPYAESL